MVEEKFPFGTMILFHVTFSVADVDIFSFLLKTRKWPPNYHHWTKLKGNCLVGYFHQKVDCGIVFLVSGERSRRSNSATDIESASRGSRMANMFMKISSAT